MNYTEKEQEHIRNCFNAFCKKVIKYKGINLWREQARYTEHFIFNNLIAGEYILECGEYDTYSILQYHFKSYKKIFR